jgi:hypothetical protein
MHWKKMRSSLQVKAGQIVLLKHPDRGIDGGEEGVL